METNKTFEAGILDGADEITALGELTYSMIVTPGNSQLGKKTNIKIVDDHGVDQIYPRSVESQRKGFKTFEFRLLGCSVVFGENIIWPIHNFKDDSLCFDSRLAVEKVDLGPDEQNHIEFEMRNFRFRDTNSIGKQEQGYSDIKLTHLPCLRAKVDLMIPQRNKQ